MGYYYIKLYPFSRKLHIIVLPWKIYEYQKLQEKMNKLFNGVDYVRTYIDDLLKIRDKSIKDHIKKQDTALSKLKSAGFKVDAEKSFFVRKDNKLKYIQIIKI